MGQFTSALSDHVAVLVYADKGYEETKSPAVVEFSVNIHPTPDPLELRTPVGLSDKGVVYIYEDTTTFVPSLSLGFKGTRRS